MSHLLAFGVDVARLCLWLVLLTLLFLPIERFFALRPSAKSGARLGRDVAYFFLNGLAPTLLLALPLSVLTATTRLITPQPYIDVVDGLPLAVRLIASIVVSEVGSYWGHRWSHEWPLLWRFHVVHHAPEQLDWLVNTRAHPVDVVFTRLAGLVPLYLLGLAQPKVDGDAAMIPVYVTLIGTFWSFFIHANVKWRFGPLEYLVSTPAFHHWHHTNDEHRDHNYAALLPVVDKLFGSLYLPKAWPPAYGVDSPPSEGLIEQLTEPFARKLTPSEANPAPPG